MRSVVSEVKEHLEPQIHEDLNHHILIGVQYFIAGHTVNLIKELVENCVQRPLLNLTEEGE